LKLSEVQHNVNVFSSDIIHQAINQHSSSSDLVSSSSR
jgi:hypothetical protein